MKSGKTVDNSARAAKARADAFMARFSGYAASPEFAEREKAEAEKDALANRRMFREETPYLKALRRHCPGFAENEPQARAFAEFKAAMAEARRESGLTQTEIAQRMGMAQPNVCRIERMDTPLSCRTFAAYMAACGCTFEVRTKAVSETHSRNGGKRRATRE